MIPALVLLAQVPWVRVTSDFARISVDLPRQPRVREMGASKEFSVLRLFALTAKEIKFFGAEAKAKRALTPEQATVWYVAWTAKGHRLAGVRLTKRATQGGILFAEGEAKLAGKPISFWTAARTKGRECSVLVCYVIRDAPNIRELSRFVRASVKAVR